MLPLSPNPFLRSLGIFNAVSPPVVSKIMQAALAVLSTGMVICSSVLPLPSMSKVTLFPFLRTMKLFPPVLPVKTRFCIVPSSTIRISPRALTLKPYAHFVPDASVKPTL